MGNHLSGLRPDIDIDAHIADVLGVLKFEDLRDVFLLGYSYGGMVASAERFCLRTSNSRH